MSLSCKSESLKRRYTWFEWLAPAHIGRSRNQREGCAVRNTAHVLAPNHVEETVNTPPATARHERRGGWGEMSGVAILTTIELYTKLEGSVVLAKLVQQIETRRGWHVAFRHIFGVYNTNTV